MSLNDPEERREYNRRWRAANRDKLREYKKRYKGKWNNTLRGRCKTALLNSNVSAVKQGHKPCNATWCELAEALVAQNYTCKITGIPEKDLSQRLHMDHDHETGRFRGWLSHYANHALGNLNDNPNWFRAAVDYLELKA